MNKRSVTTSDRKVRSPVPGGEKKKRQRHIFFEVTPKKSLSLL